MTEERDAELWLVRHGETEWSRDGKHTSVTDLDLTDKGVEVACTLKDRLPAPDLHPGLPPPPRARLGHHPSPRARPTPPPRARRTAELAGFGDAHVENDLVEWDYGEYEGITTAEIRETVPDWTVWTHPTPGGESAEQVTKRLDRVVAKIRAHGRRVLVFGHGHSLRALTARWIEQPVDEGRFFKLDTATISTLGYERDFPVVLRWNS